MLRKMFFMAGVGLAISASAQVLTPEAALKRARGEQPRRVAARVGKAQLVHTQLDPLTEEPAVYVFSNSARGGFTLVSAREEGAPLLGWSESGTFDAANPELQYWLGQYAAEMAEATEAYTPAALADLAEVAPLCKTTWAQEAPYNLNAPQAGGRTCPTGCVATAMAQVLKYHNYPPTAHGTGSYTVAGGTGASDIDLTQFTFDWDSMHDSYTPGQYTSAEGEAVAKLMQACGYAVNMAYSASSSGSINQDAAKALVNNFGMSHETYMAPRSCYCYSEWVELIHSTLSADGPVLYTGADEDYNAHAFVIDGYKDGYFHVNWGWSGTSNGYYRLSALDPALQGTGGSGGNYNNYQYAFIGAKPDPDGFATGKGLPRLYSTKIMTGSATGSMLYLNGNFANYAVRSGSYTRLLRVYDLEGNLVNDYSLPISYTDNFNDATPQWGYTYVKQMGMTVGNTYRVELAAKDDATGTIIPVQHLNTTPNYIQLYYASSSYGPTVTIPAKDPVTVTAVTAATTLAPNQTFVLNVTVNNKETDQVSPALRATITGNDRTETFGYFYPACEPGETTVQYAAKLPADFPAGEYTVHFSEKQGDDSNNTEVIPVVSNEFPLTVVAEAPKPVVTVTNFSIETVNGKVNPSNLHVKATVNCTQGSYVGNIRLHLYAPAEQVYTHFRHNIPLVLNAGESKDLDFTTSVDRADGTYFVGFRHDIDYQNQDACDPIMIQLDSSVSTTAIERVEAPEADAEYFDLQGRRVLNPGRGIYLRRSGAKAETVRL